VILESSYDVSSLLGVQAVDTFVSFVTDGRVISTMNTYVVISATRYWGLARKTVPLVTNPV